MPSLATIPSPRGTDQPYGEEHDSAETSGTYLVLDNTPAGHDPGTSQKDAVLRIVYPLSAIVTDAVVLFGVMLAIVAIVLIAIVAMALIPNVPRKG